MKRNAKEIPEHLIRLMEPKGLHTIKDISDATGIHVNRIYYGINHGRFSERTAEALSELLECEPEDLGKVVTDKIKREETLCWTCQNAVPDLEGRGCAWSRRGKPVKGWTATPSKIRGSWTEMVDSWDVKKCPEYMEDKKNGKRAASDREV